MSWIVTLIVGGVVGWLASLVMKTNAQMGILANVLVGVVGSLVGTWIAGQLGMAPSGVVRFLVAIGGAALLIFLLRLLGVFKKA